jgi:uncharacterized coiled-coil DUF342 family protein
MKEDNRVKQLLGNIKDDRERVEALRKEMEIMKNDICDHRTSIDYHEGEIASLKYRLKEMTVVISEYERDIDELELEADELELECGSCKWWKKFSSPRDCIKRDKSNCPYLQATKITDYLGME